MIADLDVLTQQTLGRRADREQSGSAFVQPNTDTFGYNHRGEVTGSTNDTNTAAEYATSYTYDQIGNRVTATGGTLSSASAIYTSNNVNQYSAISAPAAVSPTHDLDGNLTSNGGLWSYAWNNENRLKNATDGTVTIDFTYDYQGRLVKKDDGTNIEVYVYDGWNRIAKHTVNSSFVILNSSFTLWGLDLSGTQQGAGGVGGLLKEGGLYPSYDANGNIMQKLDGTGTTVMNVDFDPFGNIISGTLVGEYGFSTKLLIDNLDWYYYGFRYYDSVTGRWPSRDPIGALGGLNLYAQSLNDPINKLDLLGLSSSCCGGKPLGVGKKCCNNTTPYNDTKEGCCGSQVLKQQGNRAYPKQCKCARDGGTWMLLWQAEGYSSVADCAANHRRLLGGLSGDAVGIGGGLVGLKAPPGVARGTGIAGLMASVVNALDGAGSCGSGVCKK